MVWLFRSESSTKADCCRWICKKQMEHMSLRRVISTQQNWRWRHWWHTNEAVSNDSRCVVVICTCCSWDDVVSSDVHSCILHWTVIKRSKIIMCYYNNRNHCWNVILHALVNHSIDVTWVDAHTYVTASTYPFFLKSKVLLLFCAKIIKRTVVLLRRFKWRPQSLRELMTHSNWHAQL